MEKRIGGILILVEEKDQVNLLNQVISNHSSVIIGRQGIPLREKEISIISLVVEGTTDEIGSLSGQLGRLKGIKVRSVMARE
ncbi:MAG: CopG family transcriptional regulator [Bacteroidales bacterium]|nr:CopG family transcriptional regulator [Bacteroidales bacterium]